MLISNNVLAFIVSHTYTRAKLLSSPHHQDTHMHRLTHFFRCGRTLTTSLLSRDYHVHETYYAQALKHYNLKSMYSRPYSLNLVNLEYYHTLRNYISGQGTRIDSNE